MGPTGTGKSTLLANLIIQDISAGRGVVVLDPKGDLVGEVLTRVPEERHRDVLVIDPSQSDFPVGLNLLDIGREEHARELAVDHLTGVMASLWRSSWGPRTGDVIRNGLLTLTHSTAADGSPFTLVELPELLLNTAFRRFVTKQPTVPDSVRSFWTGYEQMSDGERAQVIGDPGQSGEGQPGGRDHGLGRLVGHGRVMAGHPGAGQRGPGTPASGVRLPG